MIRLDDGAWCFLCSFLLLQSVSEAEENPKAGIEAR
jgi:hypothetical protein